MSYLCTRYSNRIRKTNKHIGKGEPSWSKKKFKKSARNTNGLPFYSTDDGNDTVTEER